MLGLLRYDVGLDAIRARVTRPLNGLKVVAYYGCALTRPPAGTGFDHPENPRSLDEVLAALGAEVIDWNYRTECCGAGLAVPRADIVVRLVGRIVDQARLAGADALVLACQLCQSNLDLRQRGAALAVVNLPQHMGLAPRPVLSAATVLG
jgi:heterodisulfide reductase subunit B